MPSPYFTMGTVSEQQFHEDLVNESIGIYGQTFFYIPRTLIGKDEILGEDRLSEFKNAYAVDMYLENPGPGYEGAGAFIQKFGLMMEYTATLTCSRRTWEGFVGRYGKTIVPGRPCEGDLIYYPMTDALFEIKFITDKDPFFQLGNLYVYKLQIELFQYASEKINTGQKDIDVFESMHSQEDKQSNNGNVLHMNILRMGTGYSVPPIINIGANWAPSTELSLGQEVCNGTKRYIVTKAGTTGTTAPSHTDGISSNGTLKLRYAGKRATAVPVMKEDYIHRVTITAPGSGYTSAPNVHVSPVGGGEGAVLEAVIGDMDMADSYGDNNKFKEEALGVLFDEDNPFGEIQSAYINPAFRADTTKETADEPIITTDED